MKKLITLILIAAIVMANISAVYADDAEYIDLNGVPYEEYFFPPWFTTDSMPYTLEPYCIYLVYCNIFARLGYVQP